MADLVLSDIFGANVSFDNQTRVISFNLDDLSHDGFGTFGIDDTNINQNASRILWGILDGIYQYQPTDNNDETRGVYITNQGKRTALRNGKSQFAFGLLVNGYTPDFLGVTLNPNEIVDAEYYSGEGEPAQ